MRILAFDCSSTTIAYSILELKDKETKFISVNYLKPIKSKDPVFRLIDTRDKLIKIIKESKADIIAVEEFVKFFPGKSSATTIITLATFNRMLCLLAYDSLKKSPELISVMAIRHKLKINKFPTKEEMPELVAKHLNINFPYKYNKKNKLVVENYDMADAIAVGLYVAKTYESKK